MKTKELKDQIRKMSEPELTEKARAVAEELMKLRFRKVAGQLQQSHRIKALRKELARVNTVLKESSIAKQKAAVAK